MRVHHSRRCAVGTQDRGFFVSIGRKRAGCVLPIVQLSVLVWSGLLFACSRQDAAAIAQLMPLSAPAATATPTSKTSSAPHDPLVGFFDRPGAPQLDDVDGSFAPRGSLAAGCRALAADAVSKEDTATKRCSVERVKTCGIDQVMSSSASTGTPQSVDDALAVESKECVREF